MSTDPDPTLSALVVLRSASGRELTGESVITADTLAGYLPAADDVELVRSAFEAAGFPSGPPVGIAFSITAPRSRFERFFATQVYEAPDGGYVAGDAGRRELPLSDLPQPVAERVTAVTFEPPAELFGLHP